MGTAQKVEPFTLEDGYILFNADGSTRFDITIPAGKYGSGEPQYDRLVIRLLEIAHDWVETDFTG